MKSYKFILPMLCAWGAAFAPVAADTFVPETVDYQTATVTFPFADGTDGQTATYADGTDGWFKNNYVEYGTGLVLAGTSLNQTKFQPITNNESSANDGNRIDFYIIPKKGLTFTPTRVAFSTTRYGTNGGKVDVSWIADDGTVTAIGSGIVPARNNDVTDYAADITSAPASSKRCGLRLNLYSLGNTKQVGFGNIVIEGVVNGTTIDVRQCTLSVTLADDAAGQITVTPSGTIFDEGDEITLAVTENFGYHFAAWTDATGAVVSTENPYTFTITADTELTATFTQKAVYALRVSVADDDGRTYGNANLVTFTPVGEIIDGVHHYEEGTDVSLSVANNRILAFTGWEDGTTAPQRVVRMTGDVDAVVTYAAADYIVGWDFYQDQPSSERAADYRSDSENAGLLSLHDSTGAATSWLTRGVAGGAENGRWAARIWKLRSAGNYFEISFSTRGYHSVTIANALGVSYNTYAVMQEEYSIDGETYIPVGTFEMPSNGWVEREFTLPAEADNQERVRVRWVPASDELVGAATDYDGLAISDIFVLAESDEATDATAPVLVATNPADGATGASATGSIVLTFDERIRATNGTATLGSTEIAPVVAGKTAVFPYSGLDYATEYTFTLPAGLITDRSGNAFGGTTLRFTTMERAQPAPRTYDAIVALDGTGDYTTVQEAIDAAPEGRALPWLIYIKNGEYTGHVDIPATKPHLHLIGQDRDRTIIADDRLSGGDNAVHVSVGATVVVNADDTYFDNLTIENSYGHRQQAGPQALALNTAADRTILHRVALLSYQDTWITPSTSNYRAYAKDCFIEGAVDFIYNSGNIYIDRSTLYINRKSGGYIVAPSHAADVEWGYVFMDCRITAPGVPSETDVWLGRPWHNYPKTVFINTVAEVTIPAKGWYPTMGGLPVLWADYNTTDGDGNPLDLSQREDTYYYTDADGNRVYGTAKNYLTAEEAAAYTVRNVLTGDDHWQPEQLTEPCAAPQRVIATGGELTWDAVPYAICYIISRGEEVIAITTECSTTVDDPAACTVQAVNEQGSPSLAAVATVATAIETLSAPKAAPAAFYAIDGTRRIAPHPSVNIIRTTDADGRAVVRKIIR